MIRRIVHKMKQPFARKMNLTNPLPFKKASEPLIVPTGKL